ncbi:hypothetical protein THAOC_18355, partial [Thalassiosira oceanica]
MARRLIMQRLQRAERGLIGSKSSFSSSEDTHSVSSSSASRGPEGPGGTRREQQHRHTPGGRVDGGGKRPDGAGEGRSLPAAGGGRHGRSRGGHRASDAVRRAQRQGLDGQQPSRKRKIAPETATSRVYNSPTTHTYPTLPYPTPTQPNRPPTQPRSDTGSSATR